MALCSETLELGFSVWHSE